MAISKGSLSVVLAPIVAPMLGLALALTAHAQPATHAAYPSAAELQRRLAIMNKPWTRDFDATLQRRAIRVHAPYSRSLYFVDKGRERGLDAELVRDFERWVNPKYAQQLGKRPLTVYLVVATRYRLLVDLRDGLTDIAVGNLTATGQSLKVGDITTTEANIHGGAKYMNQLMTQYFRDANFNEQNRTLFAFASYNAGPGNIAKMRKLAGERDAVEARGRAGGKMTAARC